jgi:hypothetical protein
MSNNNKVTITLDSNGDTVTEVVRAYLHTGNPSSLLHRVLEGILQYRKETENVISSEDNRVLALFRYGLETLYDQTKVVEDRIYSEPTKASYCRDGLAGQCSDPRCPIC